MAVTGQQVTFVIEENTDLTHEWKSIVSNGDVNFTVGDSGTLIEAGAPTGQVTITLPPVGVHKFRLVGIVKVDSSINRVAITGDGSDQINDEDTIFLTAQYAAVTLVSNGTQWRIV